MIGNKLHPNIVATCLDDEMHERLRRDACEQDRSMSNMIQRVLRLHYDYIEDSGTDSSRRDST